MLQSQMSSGIHVQNVCTVLQTRYHHFLLQIPIPPHSRLYLSCLEDKLLLEAVRLQATRMASGQWKENSVLLNQRLRFQH